MKSAIRLGVLVAGSDQDAFLRMWWVPWHRPLGYVRVLANSENLNPEP